MGFFCVRAADQGLVAALQDPEAAPYLLAGE